MKALVWMTVAALLLVAGCQSKTIIPTVVMEADALPVEEYQIGVGDGLSVQVWKNPELSVSVPVRPDGKISTPLVGDVQAAGVTAENLAKNITAQLKNFIRSPQVTVIVNSPTSADYLQRVRLTGAVSSPTSLVYKKGMSVMDLVLMVGGVTPFADANDSKLYRKTANGTKIYPIYLDDILKKGDLQTNYDLMPNDIITVPERFF